MACISGNTESLLGKDPSKLLLLDPAACVLHYLLSHSFGLGWGSAEPGNGDVICNGLTHAGPTHAPVTAGNGTVSRFCWNRAAERSREVNSAHPAAAVKSTRGCGL